MGKNKDLSPRKIGQINVLLDECTLNQKEIAKKLKVSPQSVSIIKRKKDKCQNLGSHRNGKCGRKRKTSPRIDRMIIKMALKDRRASCRKLSSLMANEGIHLNRKTVNNRLLEAGLKAYRPRKKPRLTKAMVEARLKWAKDHAKWTSDDWRKVYKFNYHIYFVYLCTNTYIYNRIMYLSFNV